jgi:hypothetical protein
LIQDPKYKILTEFNGRSQDHNMAVGYIAQCFMKLRLGIIPTKYGSISAFKLECDQYYTHKVSEQSTMGTVGQLKSAGSGWKILMILVVNEHLKYHEIPEIPFHPVKVEDNKIADARKQINTIGQNDDITPWAVTEIREEVQNKYHTYITNHAKMVKELKDENSEQAVAHDLAAGPRSWIPDSRILNPGFKTSRLTRSQMLFRQKTTKAWPLTSGTRLRSLCLLKQDAWKPNLIGLPGSK